MLDRVKLLMILVGCAQVAAAAAIGGCDTFADPAPNCEFEGCSSVPPGVVVPPFPPNFGPPPISTLQPPFTGGPAGTFSPPVVVPPAPPPPLRPIAGAAGVVAGGGRGGSFALDAAMPDVDGGDLDAGGR